MNDDAEIRRYNTELKKRVAELENAITENKRIEEALQESEEKFRSMVELLPELIYECDAQGNLTFVNNIAFEKYGFPRGDLDKGVNVQQFVIPEDRKRLRENIDKILLGIDQGPLEYTVLRKDGTEFSIITYSSAIIRNSKPVGFRGIAIDITESKQTEEALRESEEKVRTLYDSSSDAIMLLDDKGFFDCNDATLKLFGCVNREEFCSMHPGDFSPPTQTDGTDSMSYAKNNIAVALKEGNKRFEHLHRRLDGTDFLAEVLLDAMVLGGKKVLQARVYDITGRKRIEKALRDSEEKYRTLFETAQDGIFVLEAETGKALLANSSLAKLFGFESPEDIVGLSPFEFIPEEDRARMKRIIVEDMFENDHREVMEYRAITKDSREIWISAVGVRIEYNGKMAGLVSVRDITKRKQAELELQMERDKLTAILESMVDGIYIVSKDYDIQYVNSILKKDFGSPEGKKCYEYFHDLDKPCTFCKNENVFIGKTVRWEWISPKNGRTYDLIDTPVINSDGSISKLQIFRDITDREKVKEELLRQKLQYQGIFEASKDAILILDLKGVIKEVNSTACEIYGYSYEEMIELSGKDIVHSDYQYLFKKISKDTSTGRTFRAESVDVRKDGSNFNIEVRVSAFEYEGKPHILAVIRDITERKQVENQILELKEFNEAIVNNLAEGIILENDDGIIQFANPEMLRMLGYENDELVGKYWNCFVPDDQVEIIKNAHKRRLKGESDQYEMELIKKSGERISVFVSGVPHKQKGIYIGLLAAFIDITGRKKAEEEQEKLRMQLTQAQKMESVGRLAGGVAHDFNNMLGVILGYTEMALEQMDRNQPFYSYLTAIRKAAERSADLTQQLLAFARKQTVTPRILDLNKTVERMHKMLKQIIGEDIDLTLNLGESVWSVKMDTSQIDQILANLCVNARDAIADVGKISIETNAMTFDEDYCDAHRGYHPGEYVLLSVSDNGCGMDKKIIDKIFEPFFTTKEIGKGTGLGLSTVYGIVKQNGGFIDVYSEPGHGTTFNIYIPRHTSKTTKMQKEFPVKQVKYGEETILLVEDERALLEMTKTMLKNLGYNVLTAFTPSDAIRLTEVYVGKIHLLVTDVIMPEMNGRELVRKLLPVYPNLKYLFMSGYTSNVIAHHGVLEEGVKFLQKPFSEEDMANKVREVLDSK